MHASDQLTISHPSVGLSELEIVFNARNMLKLIFQAFPSYRAFRHKRA